MRLVCTRCEAELRSSACTWHCAECGVDAPLAKACGGCGRLLAITATVCLHCSKDQQQLGPEASGILQARAAWLLAMHEYELAIEHFDALLAIHAGLPVAWLGKATAHEALRQRSDAIRALRRALDLDNIHPEQRLTAQTRLAALIPLVSELPRSHGLRPPVILVCARCGRAFADERASCAHCGVGAEIATRCWRCQRPVPIDGAGCSTCHDNPTALLSAQARAVVMRAERLHELGHLADALRLFDVLVGVFPKAVDGWLGRARALRGLGRDAEAMAAIARAFEVAPTSDAVARELAAMIPDPPVGEPGASAASEGTEHAVSRARAAIKQLRDELRETTLTEAITGAERERRFRARLGRRFHEMERALWRMSARSDGVEASRAAEIEAARTAPEPDPPPSSAIVTDLLASADRLADDGQLRCAVAHVERALAIDLTAPGGTERWRRWGALAREAALTRDALLATDAAEQGRVHHELHEVARTLEQSEPAAATVAWALAGEERARLRLLASPHVCGVLVERLSALCTGQLAAADAADSPAGPARAVAALVRAGQRRAALREARAMLAQAANAAVAEMAALVLALAARGPRIDMWIERASSPVNVSAGSASPLLASQAALRVALGDRVTLGRMGASIRVIGPGVAPVHIELSRDPTGSALLGDAGTALGTTLAGALLGAPLPIGNGLRVELGGRLPLHVAPIAPGRGASPLVVDVAAELYVAPLGALAVGRHGDLAATGDEVCWTLDLEPPTSTQSTASPLPPCVILRPAAGVRVQLGGFETEQEIDLCFGDIVSTAAEGPVLAVRPPGDERS